jgi:two-component system, OmpR family, aerobic respiration control sensor histidine kinase ArcB
MSIFDPSLDRNPSWPAAHGDQELAMLRHDLHGALAGIAGGVGQIAPVDLDPELRIQVDRIAASAKVLESLIALALDGAGGAPEPEAETDLDALIGHLRHRFAGEARELGAVFRIEMDPGLPARLRLDPTPLMRILGNLLAEALEQGAGGAVSLAASNQPDAVVFRVTGERAGPIWSTLGAARPDRGLGQLAVRTLADRLGGLVELHNRPGRGFEASLRFPASMAVPAARPAAPAGPLLAGLRILLAEDNPTNQMVASNMLRALDAEVLVCGDGVEALERFDGFAPDLVVVDIEMPRLTGLDVIRAIRARGDAKAHVPIVALTAYAMREHRDRISAAGANGLIPKPITSIEALGRALAAHVRAIGGPAGVDVEDPGSAGVGDALPVIDARVFDELCRTIGAELVGELMEKVVTDLLDGREKLAASLSPVDGAQIERVSHILISVAGAFGAVRLQARARSLNTNAQDADVPREAVEQEVRLCIAEIDAAAGFARGRAGGAA